MKCIMFCKFIGGETTHHRCLVVIVLHDAHYQYQSLLTKLMKSMITFFTDKLSFHKANTNFVIPLVTLLTFYPIVSSLMMTLFQHAICKTEINSSCKSPMLYLFLKPPTSLVSSLSKQCVQLSRTIICNNGDG